MKFVHAADLHLGAPFKGIQRSDGEIARQLRDATYTAYHRIIALAIDESVDFVLFAGDCFNSDENMQVPQLRFRDGIRELDSRGIPSYVICGNHDPLLPRQARCALPASCHIFPTTGTEAQIVMRDGREFAAIFGISYGQQRVTERLVARYRNAHPHLFSIAMLHGNLEGSVGHTNYAPFSLPELEATGFDYIALGHIHARAEYRVDNGLAVYPGSPQGLDPTETGPHGCMLVDVSENREIDARFVPLSPIVWQSVEADARTWETLDDVEESLTTLLDSVSVANRETSVALRIKCIGACFVHTQLESHAWRVEILEHLRERGAGYPFVWTERIEWDTRPPISVEKKRGEQSFSGEVVRLADSFIEDPNLLYTADSKLLKELNSLFDSANLKGYLPSLHDKDVIDRIIARARDISLERLEK